MFVPLAPLVTSLLQLWGYWAILTHILGDDILATGISGHPPTSLIVTWPFLQGNTFVFCSRLALSIRQITSETLVNTVWDSPAFIMKMPLWEKKKKKKHGLEVLMLPQQPPFFTQQHTLETSLNNLVWFITCRASPVCQGYWQRWPWHKLSFSSMPGMHVRKQGLHVLCCVKGHFRLLSNARQIRGFISLKQPSLRSQVQKGEALWRITLINKGVSTYQTWWPSLRSYLFKPKGQTSNLSRLMGTFTWVPP